MSDVLARIHVRETHGIRRFLYPLSSNLVLPQDADTRTLSLTSDTGEIIPTQLTPLADEYRLDFAVSMDPLSEKLLTLAKKGQTATVTDPLRTEWTSTTLHSRQERFSLSLEPDGSISNVVYDQVAHLREPAEVLHILYQGHEVLTDVTTETNQGPLASCLTARGRYQGTHKSAETRTEITACKSWVTQTHIVNEPDSAELVQFYLPLAITAQRLTCDFGVGGGVYGKIEAGNAEGMALILQTAKPKGWQWRLGRTDRNGAHFKADYQGVIQTKEQLQPQLWFHLIDIDKAVAVAITKFPAECNNITIGLNLEGHVSVTFEANNPAGPADFGVCYHFLNDIPAIAAATTPQSILLPPTVEVLPA